MNVNIETLIKRFTYWDNVLWPVLNVVNAYKHIKMLKQKTK